MSNYLFRYVDASLSQCCNQPVCDDFVHLVALPLVLRVGGFERSKEKVVRKEVPSEIHEVVHNIHRPNKYSGQVNLLLTFLLTLSQQGYPFPFCKFLHEMGT